MANVLELNKVTKSFGKKTAVSDISLNLKQGEIYGFLGPNGAGKTTTIRMIMDFIRPSSGRVKLFGAENTLRGPELRANVGFLSADSVLYPNWTAQQHINYVEYVRNLKSDALDLAKQFGLDLNTQYRHLSSGNKQKLALVLALMTKPKLLILDEPTRGLDPLLQQELYSILNDFKKSGGSVFMSSHNLSEVQKVCDHIGIIRGGSLVASETIDSLRKVHVHQVTVVFDKPTSMKVFEAKNVEIIKATKRELITNVTGDLNNFLANVAKHKVRDIEITHVSLEEMFLRFYQ